MLADVDVTVLVLHLDVFVFSQVAVEEATEDDETVGEFDEAVTIEKATLPHAFVHHGPNITLRILPFGYVVFGRSQHLDARFGKPACLPEKLDAITMLLSADPATKIEATRAFVILVTLAVLESLAQLS